MTLAPGQTNIGVGQSVVFSVSGGQSPRLFSLATNNSGGSIHPFSGVYVSGPIANVIDTVRVTDSRGSNAVATISVLPDLTPRPDLAIHSMLTPVGATSSMPVELIWIVTNRGNATASAPWTERIFLSADAVVGDDRFLAGFINNTALPVGGFLTRTQAVVLPPDSPAGATHFVMEVDADGQVNESSEGNNLAVAAAATAIAPQLFLTPAVGSVPEVAQLAFTVTRNGDRAAALAVTLNSSDIGELTVPVSVTIPAGVATAGFSATGVPDGAFDGTQLATVSASAPGFIGASAAMLVPDADVPHLTLTLATNRVSEGGSVVATVTREVVTAAPLVVDVSNVGGQVAFPALVTIPAGTNATTFAVVAVGDTAVERTTTVTLRVVTPAFLSATANLIVEDDDLPVVTITLANATVGEGAGASATMGTVTRDRNSPRALVIALASGNLNAALVPGNVTMPAGQTQASFTIAAVNDGEVDGTQSALISGIILETGSSFPVGAAVPATLAVTDDDGPALRLTLARELVGEGLNPATTGAVSRNNGANGALTVTLASSDLSEVTVPASVVIPNGANAANFSITSLNDGTNDGNQSVSLSVTAPGFAPASASLVVSDTDLPDLVFTSLNVPTNALTGAQVDIAFRLENQGLVAAGTNFTQRVFLSTDAHAGDDALLSQAAFSGTIPVGLFFAQTVRGRMPQTPGNYWIVAAADVNNQIAEGLENNNTRVTAVPIVVEKAYSVTVIVDVQTAPSGSPVLLHGHASRTGSGVAAAFELVSVHLSVRGTKRVLTGLTDAGGNYAITFQPLPGEAGVYAVGADHPGVANPPPQDSFTLLGLRVDPPAALRVIAGLSATNTLVVQNLANVSLAGLTAAPIAGPTNLTLALNFASPGVAADGTAELQAIVTAPPGLAGSSAFRVRLASAEGATGEFDLPVTVENLQPRLTATPGSLAAGMRRGGLTTVQFAVTNNGGAVSGPVSVLLPPLPWMAVSAGASCPPLAPGEALLVTLTLTPPADLPLGDHSGSLVVNGGNPSVSVPFTFRALSDITGTLRLSAVDELNFYAEGSPVLTNASIRLSDPVSGVTILATNLAGRSELVLLDIPEAFYTLRLEAPNHAPYQETFLLQPARTNEVVAFLSRQTVRYTWTVEPTEIQDHYRISVETEFEANVPAPVITVDPPVIEVGDLTTEGQVKQINLTIRNHGLIAVDDVRLSFTDHPAFEIKPLIEDLGNLSARASLTVPVTIRRTTVFSRPGGVAARDAGGVCGISGSATFNFICGPITVSGGAAIAVSGVHGNCPGGAVFPQGGPGGGGGTVATGGGVSIGIKIVCDPRCLILAGLGCIPGPIGCFFSGVSCGESIRDVPPGLAAADCVIGAAGCLIPGASIPSCIYSIARCFITPARPEAHRPGRERGGTTPVDLIDQFEPGVRAMLDTFNQLTGAPDGVWINASANSDTGDWYARFQATANPASAGGRAVTASERADLLTGVQPPGVPATEINRFLDRWNRTIANWEAGIFNHAQAPPGANLCPHARWHCQASAPPAMHKTASCCGRRA